MASNKMSPEEREAFTRTMAEGKARKAIAGGSVDDAPAAAPSASERIAQIDAAALASSPSDAGGFDPDGVYVAMESGISLPYLPEGEWQYPAFCGDLIAAQPAPGVYALACEEILGPDNRVSQKATDGRDKLRELWDRKKIAHTDEPYALEARRLRLDADAAASAIGADRWADPRLNVIAAGGKVADFASGERVM